MDIRPSSAGKPVLLLFNITDPEKKAAIRLLALRLGLRSLEVPPEQQRCTLRELLAEKGSASGEAVFHDEMMVMYALSSSAMHEVLDTLRSHGQPVRLKAVVTDINQNWTAARLHKELLAEETALSNWKRSRHPS